MSASGFRRERGPVPAELAELIGRGALRAGVVLRPPDGVEPPLAVRPGAGEAEGDWIDGIEAALGDRIGVVAERPALAGALGVELAVGLGARGRQVVLVDGSVEEPMLAKALPDDGDEGLVDIVAFGVSPDTAVRRTLAEGVRQVTAGSYPLSVRDVFQGEAFRRLLEALATEAAVVVILPLRHLASAASSLSTVVVAAKDAAELREVMALAPESDVIGAVVARATEEAPAAAEVTAEARGPLGMGRAAGEGIPDEPGPAGEVRAVETPDGGREEPSRRDRTWAREGPLEVVSAHRPVRLERRRPRRTLTIGLTVVAVAIAGTWVGVRAFREAPSRSRPGAAREASAPVTEEPAGGELERPAPGESGTGGVREETVGRAGANAREEEAPSEVRTVADEGVPAETPGEEQVPAEIVGPGGRYTIFVTSHRVESEAHVQVELLAREGVRATIVTTEVPDRGVWHRVAVSGGYPTLAAAREALARIKQMGYEGAWIERSQESR